MKLAEFLTNMVSDREWRERFSEDPDGTMRRARLSDEAIRAVQSGDWRHVAYVICVSEAKDISSFDPVD